MIEKSRLKWLPPKRYTVREWLEEHFVLSKEESSTAGLYDGDRVPYFWGIMHALDNDKVEMVVLQKAAQIGWTLLLLGWLFSLIHTKPSRMLMLFSKDAAAEKFFKEKFHTSGEVCKPIANLIDFSGKRKADNKITDKKYPGGFIRGFGSNSPGNVKSTPAPIVVVEEPDDTNKDVGDQGDSIRLARERNKRWPNKKFIIGGTPSVSGISIVEHHLKLGTQRVLPIVCHDCGDSHVLDWENVTWHEEPEDSGFPLHAIYGRHKPETAVYSCPHCGSIWDDWQRQRNVYQTCYDAQQSGDPFAGWVATAETDGKIETFKDLSELYVCLPGTSLADVVKDFLEAEKLAETGDESGRIVFRNSKLAKTYEFNSKDSLSPEALAELADGYPELIVPNGGLVLVAGIDVQHNRLAVVIRAYGRNEESWLIYWDELFGKVIDKKDAVWDELDTLLFSPIKHESLGELYIKAVSIDASDGNTNEEVYHWVRTRSVIHRRVAIMAIKGSSNDTGEAPIFKHPTKIDHNNPRKPTKADQFGVQVFSVGTQRAKDLIHKRLTGTSAFMHSTSKTRQDYWEQVTAEVKAPKKGSGKGKLVWQPRSGRRNEALDCEVYALHATYALNLHRNTPKAWDDIEQRLSQVDLFSAPNQETEVVEESHKPILKSPSRKSKFRRKGGGFISSLRG